MKKALSVLLALILACSCAVCAFAVAEEDLVEENWTPYAFYDEALVEEEKPATLAGAGPLSLGYTLPNVTGLKAEWNGTVLLDWDLIPYYSQKNVDVTVSFAEGAPQKLTLWWDQGNGWWWEIFYDNEVNPMKFYYIDSVLYMAYIDTLENPEEDYKWTDLEKTLPQCTLDVPATMFKDFVEAQKPYPVLSFDKTVAVAANYGEYQILAFTPETDGMYYFFSENGTEDPIAILTDSDFKTIEWGDDVEDLNFGFPVELKAGRTYYLFVTDYEEKGAKCDVGVMQLEELSPVLRFIYRYLLGGWRWMDAMLIGGVYLYPGQSQYGLLTSYLKLYTSSIYSTLSYYWMLLQMLI